MVKVFNAVTGALLFVLPNPSAAASDFFGISVAISGTRVVVGTPYDDTGAVDAGSAYVYDLAGDTPTVPVATLHNPSATRSAGFGFSVAISSTRVVVGTNYDGNFSFESGTAYVYDLSSGTPTVPLVTLNTPGQSDYDNFGFSVAISGTRVVVGAHTNDVDVYDDHGNYYTTYNNAGSAYIYDLGSATPTIPVTTLNNPAQAAAEELFGYSVAISGTRVVVGVPWDNAVTSNAGSAYVYDLNNGTPTVPVAKLNNPTPAIFEYFGNSVAISGTRVLVGPDNGRAHVYDLSSASPTVPVATLNNPSPDARDFFGYSVAISGTRVVVGSAGDDTGAVDAGSAYIYELSGGTPAVPVAVLNNPGPAPGDQFGTAVAISGTRMVVGTPYDDTGAVDAGSAYVYDLSGGTPTAPVFTLNKPDSPGGEHFGNLVAISGTRAVVADYGSACYEYDLSSATPTVAVATFNTPTRSVAISGTRMVIGNSGYGSFDSSGCPLPSIGRATVYDLSSGTPTVPVGTLNNPRPASSEENFGDSFGNSVAISGARVVVGAYRDDIGVYDDAGSAYVFDLSSATPTVPVLTLNNPTPYYRDGFGSSVAISGTRVVVVAPGDYTGTASTTRLGTVYVYDLSSVTPTVPVATLNNPIPAEPGFQNEFGNSVAISGTRVVVGAFADDTGGEDAGRAFVYDLSSATPTTPVAMLNNPSPTNSSYGNFGSSVAADGGNIVIGTPHDSTVMLDKGYVYVFGPGTVGPNTAPTISPIANQTTNEDTPTPSIAFTVGDAETAAGFLTVTAFSSNTTLVQNANITFGGSGDSRNMVVTPATNLSGSATITLTVSDGSLTATTSFTLTVNAVNDAPSFTKGGNQTVPDGAEAQSVAGWAKGISRGPTDEAGQALDFIVSNNNGALFAVAPVIAANGTLSYTPAPNANGSATVTVRLHDNGGVANGGVDTSAAQTFTISVNDEPDTIPPDTTITGGPGALTNSTSATFAFTGTDNVTPPDALKFQYSLDGSAFKPVTTPKTFPSLADGSHTFKVRAKDAAGNVDATPAKMTWTVDTAPPDTTILFGPSGTLNGSEATFRSIGSDNVTPPHAIKFEYSLDGGAFSAGPNPVTFTGLLNGPHTFLSRAIDEAGNVDPTPATRTWTVSLGKAHPTRFASGAAVPGAGSAGAPPADAVLATLGVSAIDDAGNVVLAAKWSSVSAGKGTGIFTATGSVAEIGGTVPGLSGATFASFFDPVIDAGHVAFLATLAGVPTGSPAAGFREAAAVRTAAVFSDAPTGVLAVVALKGAVAPGADGATFKSFQDVAVSGTSVAILAKLNVGSGSPAVTEANNVGLWAMDATHPLTLLLREGQIVGGSRIKTLAAFMVGDGSPGQGRGWLLTPASGLPQVMALAFLNGNAQAVLSAGLDGTVTTLSRSGPGGAGGPGIAGANFASYGVPAANADGDVTFRASLTVGAGGVTDANASGIFLRASGDSLYAPVARTGDPAGDTGAKFIVLKDPVLASDGGIAFPATIKKGGAHGFTKQTLWWKPPGGNLTLLAQTGAAADLPGAKWEAFKSLAIARDRGPIFVASLVAGRGGVTGKSANGVWAVDSSGTLRLLFRTGDTIDGHKLKSFTVLKAVPGSVGVTRSFNDSGLLLWSAAFKGGTQGVIRTTIP